ncbi:MAG: glycosyltransferase family 39 protein, partial [Chloroflexi bacterium]|nr:glycosyltransferase family 39 protein [Chloroflexota bacterium]
MTQSHSPSTRWTFWAMLAVLLLASYLRIHDLNAQGLWGDEGWSIWLARGDSLRDLTLTMVADHHGPIYSTLLRAWDGIAGQSVLALRWITVLFSVGSVALIYGLGRAMFTPAAGVGAALAFALMDKQIVLAQEVRDYPMVFFSMIAIAYFYVRWLGQNQGAASSAPTKALRRRGIRVKPASPPTPSPSEMERGSQPGHSPTKASETTPPFSAQRGNGAGGIGVNAPGYAFWFVACSVWGLYLHYYCFMVNLAILLHALITLRDRQAWRHFLALNGLIALAFAPWLP